MRTDADGVSLVVIGGSAGSLDPLTEIINDLPADTPAALLVAQHTRPTSPGRLAEILERQTALPVALAADADLLTPGQVLVIPPGHNAVVGIDERVRLLGVQGASPPRPSIDLLLSTAAAAVGARVIAVVLSGTGHDGVIGAQTVNALGGRVVIQDPRTAQHPDMPRSVNVFDHPSVALSPSDVAEFITQVACQVRDDGCATCG